MFHLNKKIILGIVIVVLATTERLWLDLGENVELVTMTAFIASFYLGKRWGILLPLFVLGITDLTLGNTPIAWFTWSAYVAIGAVAYIFGRNAKTFARKITGSCAGGISAALWFFLWTNFGVWLLDSWGMYSNDISGLIASYINGLPFLKNQLFGNMLFIPAAVVVMEYAPRLHNAGILIGSFLHGNRRSLGHTS